MLEVTLRYNIWLDITFISFVSLYKVDFDEK